jgi:NADH dehydrogenase (ubiquinone) Fe-S protein 2
MISKKYIRQFIINFGPQHPAAHGVLRLILIMKGELVLRADPHIGLLHRGTEKLLEFKTYLQVIPYFDRLDYVSMMAQEHCFILAIEKLLLLYKPSIIGYIRVIFLELTRILNHLLSVTTHALDVGAMTPFLWGFEEREKLMEFYERISGARMHSLFFRLCNFSFKKIQDGFFEDLLIFCNQMTSRLDEIEDLLSSNIIWKHRLRNIGIVKKIFAFENSYSGVMLRGTGIPWDLRLNEPYEIYSNLFFKIPLGTQGDCYDRYKLRIFEIRESLSMITQCLIWFFFNYTNTWNNGLFWNTKILNTHSFSHNMKYSMESIIYHFKYNTEGIQTLINECYTGIEAPKGELGVYLVSDGSSIPYRCKIKSPGFMHLQSLNLLAKKHLLADVVTIIGTQDIVFGEIDR